MWTSSSRSRVSDAVNNGETAELESGAQDASHRKPERARTDAGQRGGAMGGRYPRPLSPSLAPVS